MADSIALNQDILLRLALGTPRLILCMNPVRKTHKAHGPLPRTTPSVNPYGTLDRVGGVDPLRKHLGENHHHQQHVHRHADDDGQVRRIGQTDWSKGFEHRRLQNQQQHRGQKPEALATDQIRPCHAGLFGCMHGHGPPDFCTIVHLAALAIKRRLDDRSAWIKRHLMAKNTCWSSHPPRIRIDDMGGIHYVSRFPRGISSFTNKRDSDHQALFWGRASTETKDVRPSKK